MYINDVELLQCIEGLLKLLNRHSIVYIEETVATSARLTLNEFHSEALKSTYDVFYRTVDEYVQIFEPLTNDGFRIANQGFLSHLNKEEAYSETERGYFILER